MTPIYKKSQKENPENCRPVSLTFMPGKIIEQNILSEITKHVGNHTQPAYIHERRIMLDKPHLLLLPDDQPGG